MDEMYSTQIIKRICKFGIITAIFFAFTTSVTLATQDAVLELVETDTSEVFTVVDEMPEIIGGNQALYGKINYPRAAIRGGIEGRVFIQFVVDKDGNVQDPIILRDIGGGCGDAAIDAVKDVKFTPGILNGEKVNVLYSMPVTFRLEN